MKQWFDLLMSRRRIQRPAFLLHSAELANHFEPIWEALAPNAFDILLLGDTTLPQHLPRAGWQTEVRRVEDVLSTGKRYDVLISNHPVDLSRRRSDRGRFLIQRLARSNLRMMYAAGKTGWNFSDWNSLYDGVLCFGPFHAQVFSERFGLPVFEMGYPRFDKYFSRSLDLTALQAEYRCDPDKPTVVWLPTWKTLSSVGHFDEEIAALMPDYNVVVKAHPLMLGDEPEKIAGLKQLNFNALVTDASDNVALYRLADYMLFDYGGPAFGAIYTGKRFVLLNVPDADADPLTGSDSPDILLRAHFANLEPNNGSLRPLLTGEDHWQQHEEQVDLMRDTYFASHFGTSADMAAKAIMDRSWIKNTRGAKW